jgi:hypothetical protein
VIYGFFGRQCELGELIPPERDRGSNPACRQEEGGWQTISRKKRLGVEEIIQIPVVESDGDSVPRKRLPLETFYQRFKRHHCMVAFQVSEMSLKVLRGHGQVPRILWQDCYPVIHKNRGSRPRAPKAAHCLS